jgi:hypothetical protein
LILRWSVPSNIYKFYANNKFLDEEVNIKKCLYRQFISFFPEIVKFNFGKFSVLSFLTFCSCCTALGYFHTLLPTLISFYFPSPVRNSSVIRAPSYGINDRGRFQAIALSSPRRSDFLWFTPRIKSYR